MGSRSRALRSRPSHVPSCEPMLEQMSTSQALTTLTRLGREMAIFEAPEDEPFGLAEYVRTNDASNGDRAIHPSHGPADQVPRRDDGSVANIYGMDKAELEECGQGSYVPARRARADGWTPAAQATFIRALGDGGSVTRACQAAGRSRVSAYKLRRDPSARMFARAWDEAMASTATLLAETALDRALHGQEEAVYYKGERVGWRTRFDNRLLFAMLRARDPLNYAPLDDLERWEARRPPGETLNTLTERLERSEQEWERAPREELEAADRLPRDTAAASLDRAAAEERRLPEPTDEQRRERARSTDAMFDNARRLAERDEAKAAAVERKKAKRRERAAERRSAAKT